MWKWLFHSLVPRLPGSGMQTLKLCKQRDPGTFSHVSSVKGRETLIVHGRTRRLRTAKKAKVLGDFIYLASKEGILHTEH